MTENEYEYAMNYARRGARMRKIPPADLDDVAATAVAGAWRTFDPEKSAWKTWVHWWTQNATIDYWRKVDKQRRAEAIAKDVCRRRRSQIRSDDLAYQELLEQTTRAIELECAGPSMRAVAECMLLRGMRAAEVARVLNKSPNNVRQTFAHAIRLIRRHLRRAS